MCAGQPVMTMSGSAPDHDGHAAYLTDALASDDPAMVVLALQEIGTARRIPVALDENPPFGEILRAVRELGFDLVALRTVDGISPSTAPVLSSASGRADRGA